MAERTKVTIDKDVKTLKLSILEVENNNVIVKINGYRIRVSTKNLEKSFKQSLIVGNEIDIECTGEVPKSFSLKIISK